MECAFRFNVYLTIIVLLQFQKNNSKNKKIPISQKWWTLSKKCIEQKRRKIKFPYRYIYLYTSMSIRSLDITISNSRTTLPTAAILDWPLQSYNHIFRETPYVAMLSRVPRTCFN